MPETLYVKNSKHPKIHARDRNRTGTVSLQQDFKSCASASSATRAYENRNLFVKSFINRMGRGGFEPPKQIAADLQSVPFGHSGICPFLQYKIVKADDRTRTDNLLITNQLLCQLSHIGISIRYD